MVGELLQRRLNDDVRPDLVRELLDWHEDVAADLLWDPHTPQCGHTKRGFIEEASGGIIRAAHGRDGRQSGYRVQHGPLWHGGKSGQNARQVAEITGGDAFLICQDGEELDPDCVAMDVHTRCKAKVFKLSDVIRNMNSDGSLSGVLPSDYENYVFSKAINQYSTPQYIVLDAAVQKSLVVEQSLPVMYTEDKEFAVFSVDGQTRWLHSALSGLKDSQVGEDSFFVLYNESLLSQGTVTLSVRAASTKDGETLYLTTDGGETFSLKLTTQYAWYSFNFNVSGEGSPLTVRFSSDKGLAYVENYTIQ